MKEEQRSARAVYPWVAMLGLTLQLSGCMLLDAQQELDDFSAYAEKVFLHQNAMTDQILEAADSLTSAQYTQLSQAELKMHDACQLLNEYAIRERDGLERGLLFRNRVRLSIRGCDESLVKVQQLLQSMNPHD